MATNSVGVGQQLKRSGKSTREYEALRDEMESIVRTLDATEGAVDTLNVKFQSAGWLDVNTSCDACRLIRKALNKIENDASQYAYIYEMLHDIAGLDVSLPSLTVTPEQYNPKQSQDLVTHNTPKKLGGKFEGNGSKTEPDSGYSGYSGNSLAASEMEVRDEVVRVPTGTGEGNTEPGRATFEIGPEQEARTETRQPSTEQAMLIPSFKSEAVSMYRRLFELHEREQAKLTKKIKELERELKSETEAKEALQQEKDELSRRLSALQSTAHEKEKAAEKKIKEKEEELEELKGKLSNVEKKRKEMESKYNEEVEKHEQEVARLRKQMEEDKQAAKYKQMELKLNLRTAEKELANKENVILKQECEKSKLEKQIELHSKDAEIEKLKAEKRRLMRGQSIHRSLSSLNIDDS